MARNLENKFNVRPSSAIGHPLQESLKRLPQSHKKTENVPISDYERTK